MRLKDDGAEQRAIDRAREQHAMLSEWRREQAADARVWAAVVVVGAVTAAGVAVMLWWAL